MMRGRTGWRVVERSGGAGRAPGTLAALGFVAGLLVGAAAYAQQAHQYRRSLFSGSPLRRYLALGYLRGQPSVDTVRLLRDYCEWERSPRLRRRAAEVLRCVEADLD
jgi:hypothetical protein